MTKVYYLQNQPQSCCDRQLANIGGIVKESIRRDRQVIKLITKVTPNWNHCISTSCGISEMSYGSEENQLAGTRQGNRFSGDVCRDASCLIIKRIADDSLKQGVFH